MFETSLVGLQQKKGARRWLSLPLAVALHLVVLSSLVFAQYWTVDQVPEPPPTEVPPVPLTLPSLHVAQRGVTTTQVHRPTTASVPDRSPQPTQPTAPSDQPAPPQAPENGPQPPGIPGGADQGGPKGSSHDFLSEFPDGNDDPVAVPQPPPRQEEAIPYRSDMTRPQIVYRVMPQYTRIAGCARLQGTVIVQAVIDETGRVLDVRVVKPLPLGLDRATADAVAQWRFTPATLNGRPLKVIYTLTVNFTM